MTTSDFNIFKPSAPSTCFDPPRSSCLSLHTTSSALPRSSIIAVVTIYCVISFKRSTRYLLTWNLSLSLMTSYVTNIMYTGTKKSVAEGAWGDPPVQQYWNHLYGTPEGDGTSRCVLECAPWPSSGKFDPAVDSSRCTPSWRVVDFPWCW